LEMTMALMATPYSERDTAPLEIMEREYGDKPFHFEVLGPVDFVAKDFPSLDGLKIPHDWAQMNIVVDGLVSFGVKKEEVVQAEAVRKMLQKQKGKKRNVSFPDFDKKPAKLHTKEYFYRYIMMYREAKTPLFFIGFDVDSKDLDKCFWPKALGLKSRVQNPKSAKPQVMD